MKFLRIIAGILAAALTATATATEGPAVPVSVRLTHVEQDTWRVDYTFAQAVDALNMEAIGNYRTTAWTVLTPGARLTSDDAAHKDVLSVAGAPFTSLSIQVKTFDTILPAQYIAVDRFTDGGRIFFLGFLQGEVQQGKIARNIAPRFTLVGLGNEFTMAPPPPTGETMTNYAYAYFGPTRPVDAGSASVIIDPQTPAWVKETLLEATAKISTHLATAYQRTLRQPLVLLAAQAEMQSPGISIKGGAIGAQIAYRLGGQQLLTDHPKRREYIYQLVAHEMSHVWQQNVARGGVGSEAPWVHEGGAEAMALEALLSTGLWSAEMGDAFIAKKLKKCEELGHTFDTYDGVYACGFERFYRLGVPTVPLWRALMARAERTGAAYSVAMVESVAKESKEKDAQPR